MKLTLITLALTHANSVPLLLSSRIKLVSSAAKQYHSIKSMVKEIALSHVEMELASQMNAMMETKKTEMAAAANALYNIISNVTEEV